MKKQEEEKLDQLLSQFINEEYQVAPPTNFTEVMMMRVEEEVLAPPPIVVEHKPILSLKGKLSVAMIFTALFVLLSSAEGSLQLLKYFPVDWFNGTSLSLLMVVGSVAFVLFFIDQLLQRRLPSS